MARTFIVGETGSSDLWLVDTGAGTVRPHSGTSTASAGDDAAAGLVSSRLLTSRMLTGRMLAGG